MRRSGIETAKIAIILSEYANNRSTHDIDARTILAALTIEKINQGTYTCAEIFHGEYLDHLKMGGVDDVIIRGELSGRLLARTGIDHGLLPFFEDILSHSSGNVLSFEDIPPQYVGRAFNQVIHEMSDFQDRVPVGVKDEEGQLKVNPGSYVIRPGDELLVIRSAG